MEIVQKSPCSWEEAEFAGLLCTCACEAEEEADFDAVCEDASALDDAVFDNAEEDAGTSEDFSGPGSGTDVSPDTVLWEIETSEEGSSC